MKSKHESTESFIVNRKENLMIFKLKYMWKIAPKKAFSPELCVSFFFFFKKIVTQQNK